MARTLISHVRSERTVLDSGHGKLEGESVSIPTRFPYTRSWIDVLRRSWIPAGDQMHTHRARHRRQSLQDKPLRFSQFYSPPVSLYGPHTPPSAPLSGRQHWTMSGQPPAGGPPPFRTDVDFDENRQLEINLVAWICTGVAITVVAFKLFTRAHITKVVGWDDFFIFLSLVRKPSSSCSYRLRFAHGTQPLGPQHHCFCVCVVFGDAGFWPAHDSGGDGTGWARTPGQHCHVAAARLS